MDRSALCDPCYRATVAASLPIEKLCKMCERILPMSAFGLRKSSQGSAHWRTRCKQCEAAEAAKRRVPGLERNRSKEKAGNPYRGLRSYARQLGIPWEEVIARYPVDNRCDICKRTPEEASPGRGQIRLVLDHCHQSGQLRGFLCNPCNIGLGFLGDRPERLQDALEYLLRHYSPEAVTIYRKRKRITAQPDNVVALF